MQRKVNCALGLSPDSDTCRGTSCSTCGWNPAVARQRKARLRRDGPHALEKKAAPALERRDGCG